MKDQITHLPDNADRSVAKQKFKITNWPTYNKALINRGSITFWLDDEAIQAWYESATPSSRGRPQRYSDLAITTVLVIKRVFRLTLRAAQGFIDSIFSLMNVPLRCPDYSCVSRRAKSVNVSFKTPTRGEIAHLVIDSTGLKVFGEGEWKVKKHGQERRRIWRKPGKDYEPPLPARTEARYFRSIAARRIFLRNPALNSLFADNIFT
ncbi:IS5 family transposase, partial [Enterobacter cloacae]|uniref:IS5 family transposase n=1 Tax=Enterobacter cloacae TaxID=550 RepID=UPI00300CA27F